MEHEDETVNGLLDVSQSAIVDLHVTLGAMQRATDFLEVVQ